MTTQPILIRKHWFGLFLIYLSGFLAVALILGAMYVLILQGTMSVQLYATLSVILVIILLATLVSAYVYRLSSIVLTDVGMTVTNWNSLFFSNVAVCEWKQLQDVDVKKGGVFSQVLDYGTLLVQTAGTERNLEIPMIPRVEHWRDYIAATADAAPTKVTGV